MLCQRQALGRSLASAALAAYYYRLVQVVVHKRPATAKAPLALGGPAMWTGGRASWSGIKGLEFQPSGSLVTPWGTGEWGRLGDGKADVLYADFIGQQHMVRLHELGWPKLHSMRCADFENVTVTVMDT